MWNKYKKWTKTLRLDTKELTLGKVWNNGPMETITIRTSIAENTLAS
jgi:hypothetical protein